MSSQIYDKKIPQGWGVTKLGDIVDFFDNLRIPVAASLRKFGTTPYYGANGIQDYVDGFTHNGEFVLIAEDGANDLINYPVNYVNGKIWVNNHAHVVSGKNQIIDNKFLSYCLKITNFSKFLVGGTRAKLNASILKNIEILLPKDIKEQTKIAQILSDADELINVKCGLLDKKRAIKQAAAQQLLTPKPHWHTATLGEIFTFLKGKGLSKEKLISNGKFKCILYGELYTTYNEVIDSIESSTNCEEGIKSKFDDLLIPASTTTSAIDLAKASVVLQCEILIGGDINILRKKRNDVSGKFMAYYLTSTKKIEIAQYAQGRTIIHLYAKNLSDLEISYPSLLEQTKIAEILSDMDDEISALQDEIEKLKMIKQGAMDELLSGKIRLKG